MLIVLAMVLIHVSSKEASWAGFADRTIQCVFAYYCLCFAFPKTPNAHGDGSAVADTVRREVGPERKL